MRFLLLVAFSFSICFGAEVDLILTGVVMDDSSSCKPLESYNIKAYKVEDYPGHNSLDTSSVIGIGKTDSTGFFMIPMSGFTHLKNDDSICIVFEGFEHCNSVKNLRNELRVYDDSQRVIVLNLGQNISSQSITKGDTVEIGPGESKRYFTFDPVFGPSSWQFVNGYADTMLLPGWVTIDECTAWVCIRINAPECHSITACKLVKNIGNDQSYTFDFYVRIRANTAAINKFRDVHMSYYNFSTLSNYEILGKSLFANITVHNPEMLEVSLFSAKGEIVGNKIRQYLVPGKNAICLRKPSAKGLYFIQVKGKRTNTSRTIHIRD